MHSVTSSSCKETGRSLRHRLASSQMVDMAEKHSVTVCHHHQKDASGHLLQSNSTATAHLLVEEKEAAAVAQGGCKEKSDYHYKKKVSSEIHVVVVEGDDDDDDQSSLRQRWKVNYVNKLTSCEMDSLTALCDTFLPSVQDEIGILESDHQAVLANFFRTSASMAGTPQYLGGLITQRLGKRHAFLVRLALFLLSTWIGTFILCLGSPTNLTLAFRCLPRRFSKLAYADRRAMLLGWSTSWIPLLRLLYVGSKSLVLLAFFTQVNSNNHNPTWDAIGYSGPDPAAAASSPPSKSSNQLPPHSDNVMIHTTDNIPGPLDNGIIDIATLPIQTVADRLKQTGFQLTLLPNHHQNKNPLSPSMTIRCDAVVVGSGSGGGVVAGLLAKAGYKVLILEKGPYRTRTNLSLLEGESLDQMYEGAGLLTTNSTNVMILAGSTVGGGSQVNWSASIRTPEHVIREWSNEHKLDLFTSERYREAMDAVCERMGVQCGIDEEGFNNEVLRKGCLNLGYPVQNIPRNSGSDHYCGWCFMGCKDGKKQGTMETWLKDGVESGNAVILPECEVKRVVYDKQWKKIDGRWGKAKGVMFEFEQEDCNSTNNNSVKKKKVCVVVESKVTVVACGALNTPVLLRRSGLWNSNIGKNLHLHPVVMGWGYFPPPPEDNNKTAESSITSTKRSYEGGIMTAMSTVVSEFNGTGYGAVLQTPSLHPGLFSVMTPWTSGVDIKIRMSRFSRTAHILALARDRGSGKVTAASSPDIEYDLSRSDEESLNRGLEKILRVLAAAGAEEIGTHHLSGERLKVKTASEGEFDEFVRRESRRGLRGHKTPLASAHQMGSCRMGVDERKSVVDQKGETWEVEGLFVADTSVFPTAVGINPMVTVMAVAYCTAKEVMEVLKKEGGTV